ncbi:MAG: polysaccharide biosynthesis tyrosine autokinase [Chthoniobacter sp.]
MPTSKTPAQDSSDDSSDLDLSALIHAIRQRWWVVALSIAATCALAVTYIIVTPKTYDAETIIQVEEGERKIVNIQDIASEDAKSAEELKTIEQNFSSLVVLQGVVESLKLTPEQLGLKPRADRPYSEAELMNVLSNATKVKLQKGTRLISVMVDSTNPELSQKLSTETVRQFIRAYLEQNLNISNDASSVLLEEQNRLKERVAQSEKAVQDYKDAHPDVPLDDSELLGDNRMMALHTGVNDARAARLRLEADEAQVQRIGLGHPLDLLAVGSVANTPIVLQMQKDLAAAEADFVALTQRYKSKHPLYIQAQKRLEQSRSIFQKTVIDAANSIGVMSQSARATEDKMEAVLHQAEQTKLSISKISLPYTALLKNLESDRELYNEVQRRLKETEITRSVDRENIRVVQPAFLPDRPSKPKKLLVLAAAILGGALIGGMLIFGLNLADDSFKTVDQVEQELNCPVVGSVPIVGKSAIESRGMATIREPDGPLAESFRSLRASLSLLEGEKEQRSIMFTSAIPSEGKTFCSVNYAVSLAQLGERTLLIDGDLRLPTVHKLFFDAPPKLGVGSVLLGEATLPEAICSTEIENLHVLSAGTRVHQPAELIAKGGFRRLLKEALNTYDRVVIDSAPILAVSDSLLLLKDVKNVCLVVRAAHTSRRLVARALQGVVDANGSVAGIVLNQLPKSASGYYYYYSAGKYGEGVYGASAAEK